MLSVNRSLFSPLFCLLASCTSSVSNPPQSNEGDAQMDLKSDLGMDVNRDVTTDVQSDTRTDLQADSSSDTNTQSDMDHDADESVPQGYRLVHRSALGVFNDDRLVPKTFQGKEALVITHSETKPASINSYSILGDGPRNGIGGGGARAGIFRYKIYCETNACWNDESGKSIGMYGGNSAGGATVAGSVADHGCPTPETQGLEGGWSVRVTHNKTRGQVAMYSYEQNRCNFKPASDAGTRVFGTSRTLMPTFTLPEGRWVQVELEVVMNDVGEANGTGRVTIDGAEIHSASADGLMWQERSRDFGVQGMFISFQWQTNAAVTVGSSLGISDFEFYVQDWD